MSKHVLTGSQRPRIVGWFSKRIQLEVEFSYWRNDTEHFGWRDATPNDFMGGTMSFTPVVLGDKRKVSNLIPAEEV